MLVIVWICLALLIAAWLELFFGSAGWVAPFWLPAVFYMNAVFGWRPVLLPAVAVGLILDSVQGRPFFTAALGAGLVLGLGYRWSPREGLGGYSVQAGLCFLLGLGYGVLISIGEVLAGASWGAMWHSASGAIFWTALTAALAGPVIFRTYDEVAVRADLPGLLLNRGGRRLE